MEKEWRPLELVKTTAEFLGKKGVQSPRLDAEVLLGHVLHCKRLQLYILFERPLTADELNAYRELVRRRATREPVSRILGVREFMGLDFLVTPAVLSPRPETEILVEQVLKVLDPTPKKNRSDAVFEALDKKMREFMIANPALMKNGMVPEEVVNTVEANEVLHAEARLAAPEPGEPGSVRRVLDLGTGSGCIAIAVAKLAKNAEVVAVDLSAEALAVARENARSHGVEGRIDFRAGDFFEACAAGERFHVIVSNPPYLRPQDPEIWPEVKGFDPELALYGGADGLAAYRAILARAGEFLAPGGEILLEIGADQSAAVRELVFAHFPAALVESLQDYCACDRVITVRT